MEIATLTRVFMHGSVRLADIGSQFTPAQVKDFYAQVHPDLTNAEIEGPATKGDELVYTFRRAVGTKGASLTDPPSLTPFQQAAALVALRDALLVSPHFSIIDVDNLARLLGREIGGRDYDALRALHCVKWGDMPPPLRTEVRAKVVELLGLPESALTAAAPPRDITPPGNWPQREAAAASDGTDAPAARKPLRLAFWKRGS